MLVLIRNLHKLSKIFNYEILMISKIQAIGINAIFLSMKKKPQNNKYYAYNKNHYKNKSKYAVFAKQSVNNHQK